MQYQRFHHGVELSGKLGLQQVVETPWCRQS
jgi:hypothetical protein